jgi:hypothetical protein
MKSSILSKESVFGLMLFFSACLNSTGQQAGKTQIIPTQGFVILLSGDTLFGKIAYSKFTEKFISAINFTGQNGDTTTYDAYGIKGLGISVSGYYSELSPPDAFVWDIYQCRPLPGNGEMVFMSLLYDGKIKVFFNPKSTKITTDPTHMDGVEFSISSQEEGLTIEPTYSEPDYSEYRTRYSSYYVEKEGTAMLKVEKGNYKTQWNILFGDCPLMVDEVDKNPDLTKFKNFPIAVDIYNQICGSN